MANQPPQQPPRPPYPPVQYPPHPPQFARRAPTFPLAVTLTLAVLVVLAVTSAVIAYFQITGAQSRVSTPAAPTATVFSFTPVPSWTIVATATSSTPAHAVAPPDTAVLGGPVDAFTSDTLSLDGYTFQIVANPASDTNGHVVSVDSVDRVWNISVTYTGHIPSAATRLTQACHYFPPGARFLGAVSNPPGRLYQSAVLASAFTASAFADSAGNALAPGSFSYIALGNGWVIETGEG